MDARREGIDCQTNLPSPAGRKLRTRVRNHLSPDTERHPTTVTSLPSTTITATQHSSTAIVEDPASDDMIKNLSDMRTVIRTEFTEVKNLIVKEIDEQSSTLFVSLLIKRLENLNKKSSNLTLEICNLLDLSNAKVDCAVQAEYDRNLKQLQDAANCYIHSIDINTEEPFQKRSRTEEISKNVSVLPLEPSTCTNNYSIGNQSTTSGYSCPRDIPIPQTLQQNSFQPQQNFKSQFPDDWIEPYVQGLEYSRPNNRGKTELEKYNGSSLKWLDWIGMVQAVVHDTPLTPAEKPAKLKNSLTGKCSDFIQGIGGGEIAYKEILKRLKEKCGNREVHISSLDNLRLGKGQNEFVKFA